MKLQKNNLSEKIIINKYFKKLNFKQKNTFNFENDASYLNLPNSKYKFTVTTDTILENVDFFKNDSPKSIAQKITTVNLSDLFAMGAVPFSYTLNLSLPSYINHEWLNIFSNHLKKIQKQYNFYLLGGDLSKSNSLVISSTFFGTIDKKINKFQNKINLNDDIFITGNIGSSKIGLEILNKNISVGIKIKNTLLINIYFPNHVNLDLRYLNSLLQLKIFQMD